MSSSLLSFHLKCMDYKGKFRLHSNFTFRHRTSSSLFVLILIAPTAALGSGLFQQWLKILRELVISFHIRGQIQSSYLGSARRKQQYCELEMRCCYAVLFEQYGVTMEHV
eukprot:gb/GECG01012244.1/.p1 GENE.gb/GECG01012244.1/~~gb/GECG01012244.1/.p1  ORF type:complete len:110 (+),score=5.33 gb/GECG01012244.1/:1-330(+)